MGRYVDDLINKVCDPLNQPHPWVGKTEEFEKKLKEAQAEDNYETVMSIIDSG